MTGRTHDLFAFTTLLVAIAFYPVPDMSLATAITALSANQLGGLAPDLDQATSDFWDKLPLGNAVSDFLSPLLGGHRFISHSLLGIVLFGFVLKQILTLASTVLLVDMTIVWWAFMLGFVSHLVSDTFTKEGVPWLFPLPWRFGIPPLRLFRITTGKLAEKSLVFPGLLIVNGLLIANYYHKFLDFIKHGIK